MDRNYSRNIIPSASLENKKYANLRAVRDWTDKSIRWCRDTMIWDGPDYMFIMSGIYDYNEGIILLYFARSPVKNLHYCCVNHAAIFDGGRWGKVRITFDWKICGHSCQIVISNINSSTIINRSVKLSNVEGSQYSDGWLQNQKYIFLIKSNLMNIVNIYDTPLLTYSFRIIKWTQTDIQNIH
jgi:hypothetical protein